MPKDFKTYVKINALPEEVYDALTKPFAIELWTGEPAIMSTIPNHCRCSVPSAGSSAPAQTRGCR